MFDVEWDTNFDRHVLIVSPGARWEFPKTRWLPGLWTLEFGPRIGMLDAADEYAISIRLLVDFGKQIERSPDAFQYLPFHRQRMAASMWPERRVSSLYP